MENVRKQPKMESEDVKKEPNQSLEDEASTNSETELIENSKLAEERLNQLKYLQADFDNYRKNFEKEKESIIRLANEKIIKELLVVLDDLERAQKENNEN